VASSAGNLRIERLATLEQPWGLVLLPDARVLITEKPGRLRIWANGKLSEPVQGVPKVVYRGTRFEQGGLHASASSSISPTTSSAAAPWPARGSTCCSCPTARCC
jgi:glucose/arabinose dehydrogenase